MKAFPTPLSPDEENELLHILKIGSDEEKKSAKETLTVRNLRLVAYIAKRLQSSGAEMDDMISVGTIGLIKAISTFNPEKGRKLVTYASRCIENEIRMMLRIRKKYVSDTSIYEPIGTDKEGNEICLVDIMEEESAVDVLETLCKAGDIARLRRILKELLTPLEQKVINLRYGLDSNGGKEITQREVGKLIGFSRSYVSRIEKKALEKLHDAMK